MIYDVQYFPAQCQHNVNNLLSFIRNHYAFGVCRHTVVLDL